MGVKESRDCQVEEQGLGTFQTWELFEELMELQESYLLLSAQQSRDLGLF